MIFDRLERERQWRALNRGMKAQSGKLGFYVDTNHERFWRGANWLIVLIALYVIAHVTVAFARWNW